MKATVNLPATTTEAERKLVNEVVRRVWAVAWRAGAMQATADAAALAQASGLAQISAEIAALRDTLEARRVKTIERDFRTGLILKIVDGPA
jgi:hypothetical protein